MTAPINTTFTTGTTITSEWLNGVNDAINDCTQDITGAVARTLPDKLSDFVSVKDFGAVGDGVTDDTTFVQNALDAGVKLYVPEGTYIVDQITGTDVTMIGTGTFKKKSGTKSKMFELDGETYIQGITFDYDWTNADQSLPYSLNASVWQNQGKLWITGCNFLHSFTYAIRCVGSYLTLENNNFAEGAPNNNLSGGNERPTYYVAAEADSATVDEIVQISGNTLTGPYTDSANLYLNPAGVVVNASAVDGYQYKSVNITGNTFVGCGGNAGNGNVTGAIDTYNGVQNLVISGNTIRGYSYAGIKVQNSSNFSITGNTIVDGSSAAGAYVAQTFGIITTEKIRGSTADQANGTIVGNTITSCKYIGIINSCNNVTIANNVIYSVTLAILGTGIYNAGTNVNISGNIGTEIQGTFVYSSGNRVNIVDNLMSCTSVAAAGAVEYLGSDVYIQGNTFASAIASGGSGIYTTGLAYYVRIEDNYVDGFPYGVDVRTTAGGVDTVDIGANQFVNISISNYNISSSAVNVTRQLQVLPPVNVTYDAPSLAVGNASPTQTTTVTGAAVGDSVVVSVAANPNGLFVVGWVSSANTVKWYVLNPTGNPGGTVDIGNAIYQVVVTKRM